MARRAQRGPHRRRSWRPVIHQLRPPQLGTDWSPTDTIRTREARQYESYLGDPVPTPPTRDNTLRIVAININKNTKTKIHTELGNWFVTHDLDFAILADADLGSQPLQIWCSQTNGSWRPGLATLNAGRVTILYDYQRWHARLQVTATAHSPSGRSIAAHFRLGHKGTLTLIGTYCPDSPHTCRTETQQEWDWIGDHTPSRDPHTLALLAGDFNTYGTNPLDRSSPAQRSRASTAIGEAFEAWQQLHLWTSTFRHRHPRHQRHTYARAGTAVTLDDILIRTTATHRITASGIWLGSLHSSDHIGIPVAAIALDTHWTSRSQLKGVRPIRVVNTRQSTAAELTQFTHHTSQLMHTLQLPPLIPPLAASEDDPAAISHWLETAMHNLYTILYGSAKHLWGETSQTQRTINRATAIKRSNRCMAQWKHILRLLDDQDLSISDIISLADSLQWPKWVRDPSTLPKGTPHALGALTLHRWWNQRPASAEIPLGQWRMWLLQGWTHWHSVYQSRRRWRTSAQSLFAQRYRTELFTSKHTRLFLQNALGRPMPPITIRSAMVDQPDGTQSYSENKDDVTAALQHLLDNWIPPSERTERPIHLSTLASTDLPQAPRFVREWLIHDMHRPEHIAPGFILEGQCTWTTYTYTPDMQAHCDRHLRKHVAPGYGGVAQELWIAAPPAIRERERLIINTILRTGCVPPCLGRKQMLYLAKTDSAHGIVNLEPGLPPWRPITVQSAFTSRLFMVIRDYIAPIIPNEPLQHGFQKDRTVQDAVILTSLLIDRAQHAQSDLFLMSKDCLKCFDRVPSWVMEYVYLKLGVPPTPRKLMAHFLGASQIDIRTAFGWIDGGHRDFGLGQGSILAVMHIGYYMDILQKQQQRGLDPVRLIHHQYPGGPTQRPIGSLLFVDDALDVSTSYAGIQHRATISNLFTGKYASGGVFGADKSFMLYLSSTHHPAISLNNGLGQPQPVKILAPIEGFKHLGIHQGAGAQWAANTQALWRKLKHQAEQLAPKRLTGSELRYIVNAVWLPSILYRCALSDSLAIASSFDILIRKTAKRVLQLPYDHPTEWFYDTMDGLGLQNCEHLCRSQRLYHVLRIANDAGSPAYDALMDAMESYQLQMGLTDHPLANPIPPPISDQSFLGTTIRIAAANTHNYTIHTKWQSPPQCVSTRPCDQSIWIYLSPQLSTTLLQINKAARIKVRWLGDITNERGTQLLSLETLRLRFGWTAQQLTAFEHIWSAIPLAPQPPRYVLRQTTLPWASEQTPLTNHPSHTIRQRLNPLPLLLSPLGRARSVQTHGIHTINIPIGAILIIPILLTRPGHPDVLSYQIGRRDSIQTRIAPTGTEIAVTYWYEQRKGSGIWYAPSKRELRRATRLTPLSRCCQAAGTPLPTSTPGKLKFLVWTDTVWTDPSSRRVHTGANDQSCITATWEQDRMSTETYQATGQPPELIHRCIGCLRALMENPCIHCQQYHHPECLHCEAQQPVAPMPQQLPFPCGSHPTDCITQAVGDGSVIRAGTGTASGSWSVILPSPHDSAPSTATQGRLDVTPLDLTSTRCESHGLLYGLHISGDRNTQICDNQAALGLIFKARNLKRKALLPKYRDPHRVELRSFMNLLTPEGTFKGLWIRSHQENVDSDDPILNQRRLALARADALATTAHTATLHQSYATLLHRDAWELRDNNDKPVFGNTSRWLNNILYHSTWAAKQARAGRPARHTMVDDRTSTPKLCQWTTQETRFFWKATTYTLHTNARKHRIYHNWSPACRCCSLDAFDSQEHRFGLTTPICTAAHNLSHHLLLQLGARLSSYWKPDLEIYLPLHCQSVAESQTHYPCRAGWQHTTTRAPAHPHHGPPTMIAISPNHWVLALHAQRLIGQLRPEALAPIIAQLQWETQISQRRPYGYLLPRWFYHMALVSFPTLAPRDILFPQWMGGPNGARFAGPLRHQQTQVPSPPSQHAAWWIDATYQPYPPTWWAQLGRELHQARSNNTPYTYLLVVFDQSPGHRFGLNHRAKWHISIPPGALAMRHPATIVHDAIPHWKTLTRMNTHTIHIGVITPGDELPAADTWYGTLRSQGKTHWFHSHPGPQAPPLPALWLSLVHWSPSPITDSDIYAKQTREFLHTNFPTIYEAALGWQTFPTATLPTALWAKALIPMKPAQFHKQWFQTTWSTLREHWRQTCARTIASIQQHGEQHALHTANRMIRAKRKAHDKQPVGHEMRMVRRQTGVAHTTQRWHHHRNALLTSEPPRAMHPITPRRSTQWPIRRTPRRPPRKPPDTSPGY